MIDGVVVVVVVVFTYELLLLCAAGYLMGTWEREE